MYTILHLSDLHFGSMHHFRQNDNDPAAPTLGDAVTRALAAGGLAPRFDAVILSGDFFCNDAPAELYPAADRCRELLAKLQVPSTGIFCVPGNHDLTWQADYKTAPWRFYDELMEKIGCPGCKRDSLPKLAVLDKPAGAAKALALVLLDSCRVEGEQTAGLGRIGVDRINLVEAALRQASVSADTHNILAVLHHHLLPISPEERILNPDAPQGAPVGRVSLTVDSVDVLRRLSALGVSVVVHGHQHRASGIKYRNLLIGGRAIHVLAAGSCGASQVKTREQFRRHFYVHRVGDDWAESICFRESDENESEFEKGKSFQMAFPASGCACRVPDAAPVLQARETGQAAGSDLNLLLLSVVDCPESRRIIHAFFRNCREKSGGVPAIQAVRLVAMYDLLGKWDLAVKFRLTPRASVPALVEALRRELVACAMLADPGQATAGNFALFDVFAVQGERARIGAAATSGAVEIPRVWLQTTAAYERAGYWRGFILIDVAGEKRDPLLARLEADLDFDAEARQIVEAVLACERALVLEIVMKPGAWSFINRLNRAIEPALTCYHAQKYTLLCYAYDERPLS